MQHTQKIYTNGMMMIQVDIPSPHLSSPEQPQGSVGTGKPLSEAGKLEGWGVMVIVIYFCEFCLLR